MSVSEYLAYLSTLDLPELKREHAELKKKLEMIEAVIGLKAAEEPEESAPSGPEGDAVVTGSTVITDNDYRYGMLRFANDSPIARRLQKGRSLTLRYQGQSFSCTVPRLENYPGMRGRINGLSKLYKSAPEFERQRRVDAEYEPRSRVLTIVRVYA